MPGHRARPVSEEGDGLKEKWTLSRPLRLLLFLLGDSGSFSPPLSGETNGDGDDRDGIWLKVLRQEWSMDPLEVLAVRFHYGGEFLTIGGHLQYFGGSNGMSYIELDKLSLPEIEGHLADHMAVDGVVRLHWLMPGMELSEGLRLLHDDNACSKIPEHITDGGVADIYVEKVTINDAAKEDSDWELEMSEEADDKAEEMDIEVPASIPLMVITTPEKQKQKELAAVRDFYHSPSKSPKEVAAEKGKEHMAEVNSDSSDAEYQPKELNSSGEDEEAQQLRQFAKQIKKVIRAKKTGGSESEGEHLEDDDSPYMNSSDDYSYGEGSDGETVRWKSTANKYEEVSKTCTSSASQRKHPKEVCRRPFLPVVW